MIRSELVDRLLHDHPALARRDVAAATDAFFDAITEQMHQGGRVELRGFGSFFVSQHRARTGLNPRTRTQYSKDVRPMPRFKAVASMVRRLNSGDRIATSEAC